MQYIDLLQKYENDPDYSTNIIRPLSMLIRFMNNHYSPEEKIGLVLCHGHNHSIKNLKKFKLNFWYMIDISFIAFPDYICDIADKKQLGYFPDKIFDCVLSLYCPAINEKNERKYFDYLENINRLIKSDGLIILTEMPRLYFRFLDGNLLAKINDDLINNNNEIHKFIEEHYKNVEQNDPELNNNEIKYVILDYYYRDTNPNKLLKIKKKYIKQLLKENNYDYVKLKDDILFIKPKLSIDSTLK
jgi:hypothetical protein